jgi:adenosylcobinamide kinase/adenosylcobinamide-phosphate guanylyltransferase
MRVQLLGTGSADRWPNPWCRCASCRWAREVGQLRGRTSALVDDVLLVDPGPDVGADGVDLSAVRTVLITHDHPDHLDPAFLLAWQWAAAARDEDSLTFGPDPSPEPALLLAGPSQALERCADWIDPDAPVRMHPLVKGDLLVAGDLRVRALPAAHSTTGGHDHDGTALLYEITSPEGRLLYATDTKALPHADLAESYDVVMLEQTFGDFTQHGTAHLDLPSFVGEVATLRTAGRLAPGARVIAVHLSHHNAADMADRLSRVGAEIVPDRTILSVGTTARDSRPESAGRMLVTGGARSGKSRYAESVVAALGVPVTYVATSPGYPDDPEWVARIAAHRARRPEAWTTVESPAVAAVLRTASAGECVLVDCLALWLTSVLDATGWDDRGAAEMQALAAVDDLVAAIVDTAADVVLVTNEVGSGVVPDRPSGRVFRDLLGRTNLAVATACSEVALVTAGIPLLLKGEPWTPSN